MSATEAAPEAKPSRSGRLLALVRALVDYGRQVAAVLRDHGLPLLSGFTASHFGTGDIALIARPPACRGTRSQDRPRRPAP